MSFDQFVLDIEIWKQEKKHSVLFLDLDANKRLTRAYDGGLGGLIFLFYQIILHVKYWEI